MDVLIAGGLVRALQGIAATSPTLLVGLLVAAILRYYLGWQGTVRFFGGDRLRSLHRLEVGYAIRNFQLRPYQQMQAF